MDEEVARVVSDSISPLGIRLTTFEITLHRFTLAEFNTHRLFSRNSASSRAIPLRRPKDGRGMLDRFEDDPAWPVAWPCEKPGMQGGTELEGGDLTDAQHLFVEWHRMTADLVQMYLDEHPEPEHRLHKSLLNRLLEPLMRHKVIVTATEWQNFFDQRATERSPLAQPELRVAVDAMLEAFRASTPDELDYGDWHLPYITPEEWAWADRVCDDIESKGDRRVAVLNLLKQVSTARCARVSYFTHDGVRDPSEDVTLYHDLTGASPMHASPLEHPATPATSAEVNEHRVQGNFYGWHQHRHEVQPHRIDSIHRKDT